ncbi:DDRGK domain-containing protein 1-like isoform X2 [Elysia marginata]|uniref:DDRGK domain-containing protein 1-like isoform X2 n=1 Tax=Elysia marginata TaxID=1093978 RepID=A0AAV4G6B8_9GAST|nr:DDRGK domain-containing protein 1-like isoform X2 [Elysia marginata]
MAVDPATVYAVVAGSLVLIILVVTLINKFTQSSSDKDERRQGPARAGPPGVGRAAEGPRGVRRRPRGNRMRQRDDDSDEDFDDEDIAADVPEKEGKIGAKKMRKLQEKAEKKAMREVLNTV